MRYKITALLFFAFTFWCANIYAQVDESELKHRRVRVGLFAGPVNYIGDYNPSFLGSDIAIDEENSIPTENFTGDLDFGFWTKIMLKEFLYIRGNASFGTLAFSIDELDHNMNTSYKNFGIGLEASIFNQRRLRPYLTAGISTFSFTVPLANEAAQFEPFSVSEQGSNESGMAIPIGLGIDYKLSRLTTLFFETNLTLTDRDDLDNIALPSDRTDAPFTNDAFISYRFGIGFSAIEFFKLAFKSKEVKETKPVSLFTPTYDDTLEYDRISPRGLVPRDSIEADKREVFPEFYAPEEPIVTQDTTGTEPTTENVTAQQQDEDENQTTPDSDHEQAENFDDATSSNNYIAGELQRIRQMRNSAETKVQEGQAIVNVAFRNVPRITREQFTVYQQPDSIVVTETPPAGYYVMVYTSVGPESTARAKENVFNSLNNKIPAADQRVFITKREEFYEVRVGVFETYAEAKRTAEIVRGTFFDAYIMFYTKE